MANKKEMISEYKTVHKIEDIVRDNNHSIDVWGKTECIFHNDTHPSMQLYSKENKFHCFACGAHGDVIDYEKEATGKSLNEIIGYESDTNEVKIKEYIKSKMPTCTKENEKYHFDRVHFYHDNHESIVSVKIIYKSIDKVKKEVVQCNVKDNCKITRGNVNHTFLYNLPSVLDAKEKNLQVYLVEGEKDADSLIKFGLTATSAMNGTSWKKEYNKYLEGCHVILIGDCDDAGKKYVGKLKGELQPISKSFKIVDLPGVRIKEDITDWINAGHSKEELKKLVHSSVDLKLKAEIEALDFSDIGIATRFMEQFKDILKYSTDDKYYYRWETEKHRWVKYDNELAVSTVAIDYLKELRRKVEKYTRCVNDDSLRIWKKRIDKLGKDITVNMISKRYNSFTETHILSSEFDRDTKYINCKNGIVNTQTGELLQHDKCKYFTKYADVDYIPEKINVLFKGAVTRLFDGSPEEVEAFEILLGYMLSGVSNQKTFPIIYGAPNSGKTQIFEIIKATFGNDYVTSVSKDVLMNAWNRSYGASQEVAELNGARMVLISETSDADYLKTDFVKRLVGGDTIKASPLYKPSIEFIPIFVPVIFTNEVPKFNGNDEGLVNRIVIINLLYSLGENEINIKFKEDCIEDKDSIFSYLISCIVKFNKLNKLIIPERWNGSKSKFKLENNVYIQFKQEFTKDEKGNSIPIAEIHNKFEAWYRITQSENVPSRNTITRELKKLMTITKTGGYNQARDIVWINNDIPQISYLSKVI
ncbi:MAG: phage/plasmid primase, P4 family [Clostridiaceae bacterium]